MASAATTDAKSSHDTTAAPAFKPVDGSFKLNLVDPPARLFCLYHYPCPDGAFSALAVHMFHTAYQIAIGMYSAAAATKKQQQNVVSPPPPPVLKFVPMKIYLDPGKQFDSKQLTRKDDVLICDYTGYGNSVCDAFPLFSAFDRRLILSNDGA